jgi:hypothetical protein
MQIMCNNLQIQIEEGSSWRSVLVTTQDADTILLRSVTVLTSEGVCVA